MDSINTQIKRGDDLLKGHIGELASGYEFIDKAMLKNNSAIPDPLIQDLLTLLATVAPKVAYFYQAWHDSIGGDDMPHIIQELEEIRW
jgi:hypothetical protein